MQQLRYPFSALVGDYVRGLAGLAISLVIVITYDRANPMIWLFLGLTLLFLVYTLRTVMRQTTTVAWDDRGMTVTQWRGWRGEQRLHWDRLQYLSLRYYAPRKTKKKGMGSLLGRLGGMRSQADDRGENAESETEGAAGLGDGWLELSLRSEASRFTLDSALPQFNAIAQRAAVAARRNGVDLDPVSEDNLAALHSLATAAQAQPQSSLG
ncbi:hypothetical protein ACFPL7_20745 [Dongia soli]|uniref:DUF304 domain-containing protein n=1 Tax=Dongia soli TaxID=600628 RepID=A0ABU5E850_9PROT|nr:hypothetical protein [Dongia soli]MDY0882021.1 hypothetical protein [Dongia soli]